MTPRGIRNNNPLNLRYVEGITSTYTGCTGKDSAGFCVFDTELHGLQAAAKALLIYQDKHNLNTITGIIYRWAPPSENDTASYINAISTAVGIAPDTPIDLHSPAVLAPLMTAMIQHENGEQPYAAATILNAAGQITTTQPEPPSTAPQGGSNMPFLALLPLIAQFIPQIMTLIKPNSVSTAKDAQVAGTILDTVVKAAGIVTADGAPAPVNATTVAQAADKMAADPVLAKQVQTAVVTHPDVLPLLEVGGGVAAAREADLKAQASDKPFYKTSAVFWISVIMLPMIYWLVGSLIVGGVKVPDEAPWWVKTIIALFGTEWNGESRSGGFNLVVGLILGGIAGVYYGVSVTQQRQQGSAPTGQEHP